MPAVRGPRNGVASVWPWTGAQDRVERQSVTRMAAEAAERDPLSVERDPLAAERDPLSSEVSAE